jgi:MFS family permease
MRGGGLFPPPHPTPPRAGATVGSIVWGVVVDRHGRRPVFRASPVVTGVFGCLCAAAPSWHVLAVLMLGVGFGISANIPIDVRGVARCEGLGLGGYT